MDGEREYQRRYDLSCEARDRAFGKLGRLEPYVMGANVEKGPHEWPSRRAYRHITGSGYFIVATSGLSDPWQEPGPPGFGVELMIEVALEHSSAPWVFHTIANVAEGIIRPGQSFRAKLDHFGTISNEVRGDPFPNEWRSETGRVGILLGVSSAEIPRTYNNADGEVRIVPITILHPAELAAIVDRDDARAEIAADLAARQRGHASLLDRSLVPLAARYNTKPFVAPADVSVSTKPVKPWWKVW